MAKGISANISVDIEDNIKEAIEQKDNAVLRALIKIGQVAERYAAELCPVVTGRLRASITNTYKGQPAFTDRYEDDSGKGYEQKVGAAGDEPTVYIGTNVEYAPSVELGEMGRKPRHFLKKAIENHLDEYKEIFNKELSGS